MKLGLSRSSTIGFVEDEGGMDMVMDTRIRASVRLVRRREMAAMLGVVMKHTTDGLVAIGPIGSSLVCEGYAMTEVWLQKIGEWSEVSLISVTMGCEARVVRLDGDALAGAALWAHTTFRFRQSLTWPGL